MKMEVHCMLAAFAGVSWSGQRGGPLSRDVLQRFLHARLRGRTCGSKMAAKGDSMLAKLKTFSLLGIEALPVEVEVDVSPGALPKTVLVGLPEAAVKESTHRVERAIVNSGFQRPQDRVVINLAPAELPKQASSFDLPISLGMLAGSGQLQSELFDKYAVVGELALEGNTRPVKGALSMAMAAAKQEGLRGLVVSSESAAEAAVVEEIEVIPVASLAQADRLLRRQLEIEPTPSRLDELFEAFSTYEEDFADVRGQEMAKRAITIAAAGAHNLLMIGPPGLGQDDAGQASADDPAAAVGGRVDRDDADLQRAGPAPARPAADGPPPVPLAAPHDQRRRAGRRRQHADAGRDFAEPQRVLFLDELPEFNRRTLEVLRQPLEDGVVTISRALNSTTFPADFMLVAALNPCPCGYRNDPRRDCHCSPPQIERYMSKISGPLLDRIDMHIEVPAVPFKELSSSPTGTGSVQMREHVAAARQIQQQRFDGAKTRYNAHMTTREIRKFCRLDDECMELLRASVNELGLSARAHDKVLRVARTIADLDQSEADSCPAHPRGGELPDAGPADVDVKSIDSRIPSLLKFK